MSNTTKTTKEDLNAAEERLEFLQQRDVSDTSGNPDKYHSRVNSARAEVDRIKEQLKQHGDIPYSNEELMGQKLDAAFPNAQSKEIVHFEGQEYQFKFFLLAKSRSGKTVQRWGKKWLKVS